MTSGDGDFPQRSDDYALLDDIDLGPFLGHEQSLAEPGADAERTGLTAPTLLLQLRDLLLMPAFVPTFGRALRGADPAFRAMFPRDPEPIVRHFVEAMAHILVVSEESRGDAQKVEPAILFARHLGADHRKLRLGPAAFETFYDALHRTLEHLAGSAWSTKLAQTLRSAYEIITAAMVEGASEKDGPASVGATVVEVHRPIRDVAIVRLIADQMLGYHPGQYLSVQTPYAPAVWRPLSPSNPSNPARQIEFHVRAIEGGLFSSPLVRSAAAGDRWVVARPLGRLEINRNDDPRRDALVIVGSTGVAPALCLINDMLRFPDNPRVHLFYGARYPGELYALPTLVDLARTAPWLTIQPVAEEAEDPWWLTAAPDLPRTLHRLQTGRLVDVVTRYGNWSDRQVLISGSPQMIDGTLAKLLEVGTPLESISYDRPR